MADNKLIIDGGVINGSTSGYTGYEISYSSGTITWPKGIVAPANISPGVYVQTMPYSLPIDSPTIPQIEYPYPEPLQYPPAPPAYIPVKENNNISVEELDKYVNEFFAKAANKEPPPMAPTKVELAHELEIPSVKQLSKRNLKIKD